MCLPYADYDQKSRDFTLKVLKTAASADGGVISSCDAQQRKCYAIARPWGINRVYYTTLAVVGGAALLIGSRK